MNKIMQMFLDGNHDVSSMRILMLGLVGYIIAMNLTWNILAMKNGAALIPLPLNDIIAIIGVSFAKGLQTLFEQKKVGNV